MAWIRSRQTTVMRVDWCPRSTKQNSSAPAPRYWQSWISAISWGRTVLRRKPAWENICAYSASVCFAAAAAIMGTPWDSSSPSEPAQTA